MQVQFCTVIFVYYPGYVGEYKCTVIGLCLLLYLRFQHCFVCKCSRVTFHGYLLSVLATFTIDQVQRYARNHMRIVF